MYIFPNQTKLVTQPYLEQFQGHSSVYLIIDFLGDQVHVKRAPLICEIIFQEETISVSNLHLLYLSSTF